MGRIQPPPPLRIGLKYKTVAYVVNTDLCPTEMNQKLVNWPNFEETLMHDIMKITFNGPADISIGEDNH